MGTKTIVSDALRGCSQLKTLSNLQGLPALDRVTARDCVSLGSVDGCHNHHALLESENVSYLDLYTPVGN